MTLVEIANILNTKRNGTWFSIKYNSKPDVKAAFAKMGIKVVKSTETIARTGIKYDNIASVIARKKAEGYVAPVVKTNNNEWFIPNKISYNTNSCKYSVRLGYCNGHKAKVTYRAYDANGNEIPFDKEYVVNSYWTKKSSNEVYNVLVENVTEIK